MDVRGLVAAHMPHYRVDSVAQVGDGLDHVAYEVNGELIVRVGKQPDPARLTREARLLAAVAGISPLPVPVPTFTVAEQGVMAYFKIPGVPLLDTPRRQRSAHNAPIAATLGELLTALHAAPVDRMAELVDTDDHPLAEWRCEAAQTYLTVAGQVPAVHRRSVEAFLDTPPPDDGYTPVFSHNDLGIEHVLIDPIMWTVTGIIDWSDAAIVDPAYDFGLLYRDLGPAATRVALRDYPGHADDLAALSERAVFYARCAVFEDLAYGLETGLLLLLGLPSRFACQPFSFSSLCSQLSVPVRTSTRHPRLAAHNREHCVNYGTYNADMWKGAVDEEGRRPGPTAILLPQRDHAEPCASAELSEVKVHAAHLAASATRRKRIRQGHPREIAGSAATS